LQQLSLANFEHRIAVPLKRFEAGSRFLHAQLLTGFNFISLAVEGANAPSLEHVFGPIGEVKHLESAGLHVSAVVALAVCVLFKSVLVSGEVSCKGVKGLTLFR
jgi:hypothetical protein